MTISSYQIQNILQIYNRQLKTRWTEKTQETGQTNVLPRDVVEISDEGKKKHIMDRTGDDAVKRLKEQTLEELRPE